MKVSNTTESRFLFWFTPSFFSLVVHRDLSLRYYHFRITSTYSPSLLSVYREDQHKGKHSIPETVTGEEGTAKRNILRKHDHDPHRKDKKNHGGGGGKPKWDILDDGSLP